MGSWICKYLENHKTLQRGKVEVPFVFSINLYLIFIHFLPQPLMRLLATQSLKATLSGCPMIASRMPLTPSTMMWAIALSRPVQGSRIMESGAGMLWRTAAASPKQRRGRSSAMATHCPPKWPRGVAASGVLRLGVLCVVVSVPLTMGNP